MQQPILIGKGDFFMLFLNGQQWTSVIKGAVVAAVGAGLTYLATAVGGMDFGANTPFVTALFAVGVNYVRKVVGIGESA